MKKINTLKLLSVAFMILILSSCGNEAFIERIEDRVEGAWYFDKVTFNNNGFNNENWTDDYESHLIEFFSDNTVEYTTENGTVKTGIWKANRISTGEEGALQVVISLEDAQSNKELYIWDNLVVNNRVMRTNEDFENGVIRYRLKPF